jgi:glyoxylase-like metal-dependent hydrolase (beta-lactamase superfamily II)
MPRLKLSHPGITLTLALVAVPTTATAQASPDELTTRVAEGVYAYGNVGGGYLSMFLLTDEGVLVVEPVDSAHSEGMLRAIERLTDKPIRYLLHSHNHWDHSRGGQVFRDAGATVLAHVEAYEWMKANPHPEMALPDESWAGRRKDIVLGDKTLELHYLGMNHGLGMTVFRVPEARVVYIADIVTPNRVLFTIVPDFNIKQWERSLREVERLDFDRAIYSHNHAGPYGTKADVTKTREFIEDLRAAINAEFAKGTSPFLIPQTVRLPKYEHWDMYDEYLEMNAWRVLLDDWMGPFPWHGPRAEEKDQ